MANIWVKTIGGDLIRHDRITGLSAANLKGRGWSVVATLGRGAPVILAVTGRGGRAQEGADRLATELPQAFEAAKGTPGQTIRYISVGYPKGGGRWVEPGRAGGGHAREGLGLIRPGVPTLQSS